MSKQEQMAHLAEQAFEQVKAQFGNLEKVNIVVAGKSGVGKSTLINATFGERLAETGMGKPVTDHIKLIEKPDFPVRIYDTVGFELGQFAQWKSVNTIHKLIKRAKKTDTVADDIHCLWYCIAATGGRIDGKEQKFIKFFLDQKIPVILVLTKAIAPDMADALSASLHKIPVFKDLPTVNVLAEETAGMAAFGIDQLVTLTADILPEALQQSFAYSQRPDFQMKRKLAGKIIAGTTLANFGTGFIPLDFADAPVMMAAESNMLYQITGIYQVALDKHQIETVLASIGGIFGAQYLGVTTAKTLLKLIPGVGIATSAISGTVAGTVTVALGYAYVELMEMVVTGKLDVSGMMPEEIRDQLILLMQKILPNAKTILKSFNNDPANTSAD
ncbi:YcjF family protein [Lacticaseibacillus jixianensis]|uniref:YcjF family protein n=1 Tax=Lacticaseibacillus jixianensis TaxID=2486012 RepID=A0ABW4BC63_9LACO|nr:GTPase [Lacticaseibacillus jixianensis]